MTVQLINIGNIANDGTGDDLREAFIKVNQNFEDLDLRDDEQTSASNLGTIGEGVFNQRLNYDLQFKKIAGGDNVTVTSDNEKIIITADGVVSALTVTGDTGSSVLENDAQLSIQGGSDISTSITEGVLTIDYVGLTDLASDTSPQLSADLDAQANNLLNVGTISSSGFTGPLTGNVTGLVHGIDIRNIGPYFENNSADFGSLTPTINNLIEYFIYNTDIEWGSIVDPSDITFDLGSL